jgi:hypothetical protein
MVNPIGANGSCRGTLPCLDGDPSQASDDWIVFIWEIVTNQCPGEVEDPCDVIGTCGGLAALAELLSGDQGAIVDSL